MKSLGSSSKSSADALVSAAVTPTKGVAKPADRTPPTQERVRKTTSIETTWGGVRERPRAEDFAMAPAYVESLEGCSGVGPFGLGRP